MWHGQTVSGKLTNVPLMFHGPSFLPEGLVIRETVQNVDHHADRAWVEAKDKTESNSIHLQVLSPGALPRFSSAAVRPRVDDECSREARRKQGFCETKPKPD